MDCEGAYMHLDEILKNYRPDNHVDGSSYIELQPGLSVCVVTAEHLNAVDVCKKFPSCNNHVCFNCQLQGKLQMQIKDRHFSTHKGDLIFGFTGGENFCLQHSDDFCNVEVMVMPKLLEVLLGDIDFQFSCLDHNMNFFLHHHKLEANKNVLSSARQLYHLIRNTDCRVTNRLLLYAYVLEYLNWYFHAFNSCLGKQEFTQREYKQINVAHDYLLKDLSSAPTIDWLAKQVGMNQNKLKKGFKKVFGKSIYAYFLAERMNKAKQLLVTNSVTETAIIMGYSNISHFSSAFRKQFGVLPKEVRQQNAYTINNSE